MFRYLWAVLWYRMDLCEKEGVGGWGSAVLSLGTIQRSSWGVGSICALLRVFCFLSLCHLAGSCWGGRALWSSPVGDGEKWQVRQKASIYISGAGGDICRVGGGLAGGYECGNLMVLTCMRASQYLCVFKFSSFYYILFINKPTRVLILYKLSHHCVCKLST